MALWVVRQGRELWQGGFLAEASAQGRLGEDPVWFPDLAWVCSDDLWITEHLSAADMLIKCFAKLGHPAHVELIQADAPKVLYPKAMIATP